MRLFGTGGSGGDLQNSLFDRHSSKGQRQAENQTLRGFEVLIFLRTSSGLHIRSCIPPATGCSRSTGHGMEESRGHSKKAPRSERMPPHRTGGTIILGLKGITFQAGPFWTVLQDKKGKFKGIRTGSHDAGFLTHFPPDSATVNRCFASLPGPAAS